VSNSPARYPSGEPFSKSERFYIEQSLQNCHSSNHSNHINHSNHHRSLDHNSYLNQLTLPEVKMLKEQFYKDHERTRPQFGFYEMLPRPLSGARDRSNLN
jgi:hypothetical protein